MATDNTNIFGGGNKNSLYIPISDDEQEVIHRLLAANDLQIEIEGWGIVNSFRARVGDLNVAFEFQITIPMPEEAVEVFYLDLKLATRSGLLLKAERMAIVQMDGKGILMGGNNTVHLEWAMSLAGIDPTIVKLLKPGAIGLTSRRLDKDTGEFSKKGNMKLTKEQIAAMQLLQSGQDNVNQMVQKELKLAAERTKLRTKKP